MVLCWVVLTAFLQAGGNTGAARLAALGWMAGDWTATDRGAQIEEYWTAPGGGIMLGMSRTVRAGRPAFEYLRIVEGKDALVYIAQPGGRPPTEFVMSKIAARSVTFENRSHDFPKVIVYRLTAEDTMEARVGDGASREDRFVFKRRR
jgi:hypothetical protein